MDTCELFMTRGDTSITVDIENIVVKGKVSK